MELRLEDLQSRGQLAGRRQKMENSFRWYKSPVSLSDDTQLGSSLVTIQLVRNENAPTGFGCAICAVRSCQCTTDLEPYGSF